MKVLIIQGAVGPLGNFKKGEERELSNEVATQLIKDGIAKALGTKPQEKAEHADSIQAKKRNKR